MGPPGEKRGARDRSAILVAAPADSMHARSASQQQSSRSGDSSTGDAPRKRRGTRRMRAKSEAPTSAMAAQAWLTAAMGGASWGRTDMPEGHSEMAVSSDLIVLLILWTEVKLARCAMGSLSELRELAAFAPRARRLLWEIELNHIVSAGQV